jgi:phosphatidylglycerophosphatase A
VGRIPFAPGTFGSVLGLGVLALLMAPGSWWVLGGGIVLGAVLSVWLCGESEKILGKTDPGCVVADEVIAIPLCFVGWLAWGQGVMPSVTMLFVDHWPVALAGFGLFRLFDIWKPWPVRQSQRLPGGWGVTVDDLLAAVYVNLVLMGWRFFVD